MKPHRLLVTAALFMTAFARAEDAPAPNTLQSVWEVVGPHPDWSLPPMVPPGEVHFREAMRYLRWNGFLGANRSALHEAEAGAFEKNPKCMVLLARFCEKGIACEVSPALAAKWYRAAAALHEPEAFARLGCCYLTGFGVNRDAVAARLLFAEGAKCGSPESHYRLAVMLLEGEGGFRDVVSGCREMIAAGNSDHTPAMRRLAVMFERGDNGAARDIGSAYKWALAAYMRTTDDDRKETVAIATRIAKEVPPEEWPAVRQNAWNFHRCLKSFEHRSEVDYTLLPL